MSLTLKQAPRLGRKTLRIMRVRPDVLTQKRVPLRVAHPDFVCRQLRGRIHTKYEVPSFIRLDDGEIDLFLLNEQLYRDFCTSISWQTGLKRVLADPRDALCVIEPGDRTLFRWDGEIASPAALFEAFAQRGISLDERGTTRVIENWELSRAFGNKVSALRGPATKREILEAVVGRLGVETCLEERPEADLLRRVLEDVRADRVDSFRALAREQPTLAYDFSALDLGGVSLEMALAVYGVARLEITPHVSLTHRKYLKDLLLYANHGNHIVLATRGETYLSPQAFRARRVSGIKLSRSGVTFITQDGQRFFKRARELEQLHRSFFGTYLNNLDNEVKTNFPDTLLDYYEELTTEALKLGITIPDNYAAGKDTYFQRLMDRLLEKYFKVLSAQLTKELPTWAAVEFHRDGAIFSFQYRFKEIDASGPAGGFDMRFIKKRQPSPGNLDIASSALSTRQDISPTIWERLNKVARRWREVNPGLEFGVH